MLNETVPKYSEIKISKPYGVEVYHVLLGLALPLENF